MGAKRVGIGGRRAALLGTLALLALLLPARAAAQTAPGIVDTTIDRSNFPADLTFSALVDNPESLASAVLFYQVPPEGAITRAPAEVTSGDVTRLSATLPTNTGPIYIPPGAEIEWFWQLTATDRTTVETVRETFRYEDPRYDWQLIERGDLQLHYYDSEGDAEELLVVGSDAIARMSELLGIQLDFPARIYLWSSAQDAAGVERVESDTFEQLIFTGGTRVLADLVHVFAPEPWIVAHELTHILTKVAGEGGVGSLPAWLDEGTATYAERDWRSRRGLAIARAVENDDVLSVRSIGSSTSNPGDVDLFYGESADIVTFLIDRFGEEQFAQLFVVFREGSTVDNALQTVYGFDRDGLDAAYRESLGLEPRIAGEDRSTQIEDEPIAPAGTPDIAPAPEPAPPPDDVPAPESDVPAGGRDGAQAESQAEAPRVEEREPTQIATRGAAVERWNATLRLGPSFGPGDGFPWAAVVTGLASGALLLSLVLLVLAPRGGRLAPTDGAVGAPASLRWEPPASAGPILPPESGVQWDGWRAPENYEASDSGPDERDRGNAPPEEKASPPAGGDDPADDA